MAQLSLDNLTIFPYFGGNIKSKEVSETNLSNLIKNLNLSNNGNKIWSGSTATNPFIISNGTWDETNKKLTITIGKGTGTIYGYSIVLTEETTVTIDCSSGIETLGCVYFHLISTTEGRLQTYTESGGAAFEVLYVKSWSELSTQVQNQSLRVAQIISISGSSVSFGYACNLGFSDMIEVDDDSTNIIKADDSNLIIGKAEREIVSGEIYKTPHGLCIAKESNNTYSLSTLNLKGGYITLEPINDECYLRLNYSYGGTYVNSSNSLCLTNGGRNSNITMSYSYPSGGQTKSNNLIIENSINKGYTSIQRVNSIEMSAIGGTESATTDYMKIAHRNINKISTVLLNKGVVSISAEDESQTSPIEYYFKLTSEGAISTNATFGRTLFDSISTSLIITPYIRSTGNLVFEKANGTSGTTLATLTTDGNFTTTGIITGTNVTTTNGGTVGGSNTYLSAYSLTLQGGGITNAGSVGCSTITASGTISTTSNSTTAISASSGTIAGKYIKATSSVTGTSITGSSTVTGGVVKANSYIESGDTGFTSLATGDIAAKRDIWAGRNLLVGEDADTVLDFITTDTTSGIWTKRIWKSGKIEYYCYNKEISNITWESSGITNLYRGNASIDFSDITECLSANISETNGTMFPNRIFWKSSNKTLYISVFMISTTTPTSTTVTGVSMHIIGK